MGSASHPRGVRNYGGVVTYITIMLSIMVIVKGNGTSD